MPVVAAEPAVVDRTEVERRAAELGLAPVRWPDPFPFDTRTAALAATYAKQTGRGVAFSLAAMRQAFTAGRDLSAVDNVLIAAAACELHPRAVLKGIESTAVARALDGATARWGSPFPSPALTWASADFACASADLAWASASFAFSLSSTSIGPEVTPSSERVRAEKRATRASTNRLTARRGAHRLRMTVRIVSRMLASRADGGHCPAPYGP